MRTGRNRHQVILRDLLRVILLLLHPIHLAREVKESGALNPDILLIKGNSTLLRLVMRLRITIRLIVKGVVESWKARTRNLFVIKWRRYLRLTQM